MNTDDINNVNDVDINGIDCFTNTDNTNDMNSNIVSLCVSFIGPHHSLSFLH